jgi:protein SCO1/2
MSRRHRLLVPGLMTALLLGALAFAILAAGSSPGGGSSPAGSTGATVAGAGPATSPAASGFDGAALPNGVRAPGFTLIDEHGARVSLASLRGRTVVLAFLYSTCGGSCAVIAQQIRGALDELRHPVAVLVVSVAPAADSGANVRRFLASVSLAGRARWLSGSAAALRAVWRSYRVTPASAGRAAFVRAATVVLIDRAGNERVLFGPEQLTPEGLAHDIGRLEGDRGGP